MMYIKDARKTICKVTGEFVHMDIETAKAWLQEAEERSIQPERADAGNEVWFIYRLDDERRVITASTK